MSACTIIAIAGGSGSGKTTFARELQKELGDHKCGLIYQDSYYFDQSDKFDKDGGAVNFDHPSSIDFELMASHLRYLKQDIDVKIPIYEFSSHSRKVESIHFPCRDVILVDGILLLGQEVLRPLFDRAFYIDCPEDLRFERRLKRDVEERGRTAEGVKAQFNAQVKPMHDEFVEPSRKHASRIVTQEAFGPSLEALANSLR